MGSLGAQGWRIWLWVWIKTDQSKYQWQTIKVADWMATWHPLTFPNQIRTLAGPQVGTVTKNTRSCAKSKAWKTSPLPIEILFSNCQVSCMDLVEHVFFIVFKNRLFSCSSKIGWLQIMKNIAMAYENHDCIISKNPKISGLVGFLIATKKSV